MKIRALLVDEAGAAVIEFALLAPIMIMMIFGVIETGRLFWTQHTIDEVAYSTARCISVSLTCEDIETRGTYAKERAAAYGIAVPADRIVASDTGTCKGFAESHSVRIEVPFRSVLSELAPGFPQTLTARACFPKLREITS
ncbi:TadE/TadG family type IV pilus assembly protein [Croceicoccus hydrothermalis]|uniref:TadE/TadG family type IV pilus assembly protein n=1 Tax=Croceicoccus hydrothermalis TaxID=2867964 RepID=UPI001EFA84BA|nr:TadE/TadG family type IV pilus assembly protein [Croceicoccus hydrothermalis]